MAKGNGPVQNGAAGLNQTEAMRRRILKWLKLTMIPPPSEFARNAQIAALHEQFDHTEARLDETLNRLKRRLAERGDHLATVKVPKE